MNKRIMNFILVLCMIVALVIETSVSAFAEGNYGANTESSNYKSNDNPFFRSGLQGQCTWYCWGRAREKCGVSLYWGDGHYGNAGTWLSNAEDAGYSTGSTPQENSIAVWETIDGSYKDTGHVAFVESVSGNTIYISEYNYNITGGYTESTLNLSAGTRKDTFPYNKAAYYPRMPDGYIYLGASDNLANLGSDFYALILHDNSWMPISQVEDSTKIFLKTEDGSARQYWHFQRENSGDFEGAYVITSCYDGKALEMYNGVREVCSQISAQSPYWGGAYQRWYLIPYDDGYILKSCHYRDEDWVMDLYAGDAVDGNVIQINKRNNSGAQVWAIYKIENYHADIGDDFYATILHQGSLMPISKVEGSSAIFLKTEDGSDRQIWHFQRDTSDNYAGSYIISSCSDGKVLEMHNGIREKYEQLTAQSDYWGGAYQRWYLVPHGGGFVFKNCHYRDEDWAMELRGNNAVDGNLIYINRRDSSPEQIWTVSKVDNPNSVISMEELNALGVYKFPEALTEIQAEAFLGTQLESVFIPASVVRIGDNVFSNGITIYGLSGSEAERYAKQNGLTFITVKS